MTMGKIELVLYRRDRRDRVFRYKTLKGAQRKARALVGDRPIQDPDGYAVGADGQCLFINGATFEEIFER